MADRTMLVHVGGERFVFRDQEVDRVLELGAAADDVAEAWDRLQTYGRQRHI